MLARSLGTPREKSSQESLDRAPERASGSGGEELATVATERPQIQRVAILCWPDEGIAGPTDSFLSSGKHVAATGWTRSLAQYGTIPNLDLFFPLMAAEQSRRQFGVRSSCGDVTSAHTVRFLVESGIPPEFRQHAYDVVHPPMGVDFTRSGYIRSRFARRLIPATCSQHGISSAIDLQFSFIHLLTAETYPCDAIICLTESSRRALANRVEDLADSYGRAWERPGRPLPRLELIPWGVDTERFAPREREAARYELELPLDRPIVLCIGRVRIVDKMDWTPMLLAFEQVKRRMNPSPYFVLAGSSLQPDRDRVVAHAAQLGLGDDIRTFFNAPPACLASLYAACDVFVSPVDSPSESFGLTVVEAMASGRAVVASDWDGYRELIVHGETGYTVRTDWADCLGQLNQVAPILSLNQDHLHVGQSVSVDVGQLTAYLMRLIQNRELRERMGSAGRKRVLEQYAWPRIIRQWEALWTELSAIARSFSLSEVDRFDYLQPNYFRHFAHYASRIIDDSVPVELTARGKGRSAEQVIEFLHPWTRGFLDPRFLQATLAALRSTAWLHVGLPVGKLVKIMRRTHGLERDDTLLHIMWLAKYDLVSLGDAVPHDTASAEGTE
jgi:D-inositol-3-phosphate glycosyltransferase